MDLLVAVLIVLGAAAVSGLVFALVYRRAGRALMADSGRGRPMIQVTGTLFAVVVAFVILAAFQTYNGARTAAQSEAQAVLDMARTAALFPPPQRDELRADFICYGRAVVDQEWPAMRHGQSSAVVDNWVAAYRELFGRLTVRSPAEQVGLQDLVNLANTPHRRTSAATER